MGRAGKLWRLLLADLFDGEDGDAEAVVVGNLLVSWGGPALPGELAGQLATVVAIEVAEGVKAVAEDFLIAADQGNPV